MIDSRNILEIVTCFQERNERKEHRDKRHNHYQKIHIHLISSIYRFMVLIDSKNVDSQIITFADVIAFVSNV